jgi:CDP-glucose 4,6-dehydratase
VTGARGFAGSWVAKRLLADGAEVVSFDLDSSRPSGLVLQGIDGEVADVTGDVMDGALLARVMEENSIETVFHLAAQAIVGEANRSPMPTFETNIGGTMNVLDASRRAGVQRVIVASSDKAYGAHEQLPYTEDAALEPVYPYDVSKAAADLIARSFGKGSGMSVAVTRFANIYGGGDLNFSRLIPEAVTAVLDGRPPVIRSDGSPERDYLYVEDAARAYVEIDALIARGEGDGEAFNAGWSEPHSVREVVDLICDLSEADVEPNYEGAGVPEGEIDRQYLDSTKLREATGWKPEVELREGLSQTLDWYRDHPDARPDGTG